MRGSEKIKKQKEKGEREEEEEGGRERHRRALADTRGTHSKAISLPGDLGTKSGKASPAHICPYSGGSQLEH